MKKILLLILTFFYTNTYDFHGIHFIASYKGCPLSKLTSLEDLTESMTQALDTAGATIIQNVSYKFEPTGSSIIFLLCESHASMHVYPEHYSCFVDLFTCGTQTQWELFHYVLCDYLQPTMYSYKVIERK